MAAAALILVVDVPLLIGVFAAIHGLISVYHIISMSHSHPKPSTFAAGYSLALVAPMVGMLLMIPEYATAVIGAIIRSFAVEDSQRPPKQ